MDGTWLVIGVAVGYIIGYLCQNIAFWLYRSSLRKAADDGWTARQFLDFWEDSQSDNWRTTVLSFARRLLGIEKAVFTCPCGNNITIKVPFRKKSLRRKCECQRLWWLDWKGDRWDVGHTRLKEDEIDVMSYAQMEPLERIDPSVAGGFTPDPEDITNPSPATPMESRLAALMKDWKYD